MKPFNMKPRLKPVTLPSGRTFGHGQQLAAMRTQSMDTTSPASDPGMTRQVANRIKHHGRKALLAKRRREDAEALLAAIRANPHRKALKKAPGLMTMLGRPYKKSLGKPGRSVIDLPLMPNGQLIPAGCDATFHHTKGLRVVRIGAI